MLVDGEKPIKMTDSQLREYRDKRRQARMELLEEHGPQPPTEILAIRDQLDAQILHASEELARRTNESSTAHPARQP